jgi:acyl-CoA thioester hydrolase
MLTGTITSGIHHLAVRVYYEDTDFSGYVYHSNYLKFCERARSDYLRVLGVDQNAMFADGGAFVVRRMNCDFLRPARFDDVLIVESTPGEASGARFEVRQRVLRGDDVLFTADVTAVFIDGRGRPKRLTSDLLQALSKAKS